MDIWQFSFLASNSFQDDSDSWAPNQILVIDILCDVFIIYVQNSYIQSY